MHLLVVRHAVAEDRDEFAETGRDDSERPLTKQGKWRMERLAKGLRAVVPAVDLVGSSPLVRAMQTAEILSDRYGKLNIVPVDALAPASQPQAFLRWLRKHEEATTVAVVGHEPHLGGLVSWLLAGTEGSWMHLKKGGACLLDLPVQPTRAGTASLVWTLPPQLLRRLSD